MRKKRKMDYVAVFRFSCPIRVLICLSIAFLRVKEVSIPASRKVSIFKSHWQRRSPLPTSEEKKRRFIICMSGPI